MIVIYKRTQSAALMSVSQQRRTCIHQVYLWGIPDTATFRSHPALVIAFLQTSERASEAQSRNSPKHFNSATPWDCSCLLKSRLWLVVTRTVGMSISVGECFLQPTFKVMSGQRELIMSRLLAFPQVRRDSKWWRLQHQPCPPFENLN